MGEIISMINDISNYALSKGTPENFLLPLDPISASTLVRKIQNSIDTSKCSLYGINVWVLIRNEIFYSISKETASFFEKVIGKPGYQGRVFNGTQAQLFQDFDNVKGSNKGALISNDSRKISDIKGGVVFCEVPGDYTQFIDGLAINCFSDSMIELMLADVDKIGPLTKLCRLQPRMATVSKLVEPLYYFHDSSSCLFLNRDLFTNIRKTILEVNRFLLSENIPITLNVRKIETQIEEIISYRNSFVNIFNELKPKAVVVQNFANIEKWGAIFAAKEMGIPTIDIQHGIQENTSMYNVHPAHCGDGTYLYPDTLWCWGKVTADALNEEKEERPVPWKRAIEGGHPWKWLVETHSSSMRLERLRRQLPKNKKIAVYCHDPALINSKSIVGLLPEEIFKAILKSTDTTFWLIRLHPRAVHLIPEFQAFCVEHKLTNVEFEMSSALPLEQVLKISDVLLSKFSVSALESMSVGVPVVCHSWIGEVTFQKYKDNSLLHFADTPTKINNAILRAEKTGESFQYVNNNPEYSKQSFLELIASF